MHIIVNETTHLPVYSEMTRNVINQNMIAVVDILVKNGYIGEL